MFMRREAGAAVSHGADRGFSVSQCPNVGTEVSLSASVLMLPFLLLNNLKTAVISVKCSKKCKITLLCFISFKYGI